MPDPAGHVEVGAQGRTDQREQPPEDAVGGQGGHLRDRRREFLGDLLFAFGGGVLRIEPGLEQPDEQRRGVGGAEQHTFDVVLAVGEFGLAQVLRVGAEKHDLLPGEPGAQHELVEPVGLDRAPPGHGEGVGETIRQGRIGLDDAVLDVLGQAESEIVYPAIDSVRSRQPVGSLVDDLDAEALQHREDPAEGDRLVGDVQGETQRQRIVGTRTVQVRVEIAGVERFQTPQVVQGTFGTEVLLVRLGHDLGVPLHQQRIEIAGRGRRLTEPIGPVAGHFREHRLDPQAVLLGGVHLATCAPGEPDRHVQQREVAFGDPRGVVEYAATELAQQDVLDRHAHLRRIAVARQVDQARDVPPVGVDADEQPHLPADVDHRRDGLVEGVGVHGEQFRAGHRLHDLEHRLAAVGRQLDPRPRDDLPHPARDHGDVEDVLVQSGHREDTEETILPDDRAVGVKPGDADEVRIDGTVHGGGKRALSEHEERTATRADLTGQVERVRDRGIGAQHSPAAAGHGRRAHVVVAAVGHEVVAPVAEEGEVPAAQPAQQFGGLGELVGRVVRRRIGGQAVERVRQVALQGVHLPGVRRHLPHIGQYAPQAVIDLLDRFVVDGPAQLDVHP